MEKAFDIVWHDGLLHKLIKANVPRFLVRIMKSYLSGQTLRLKVEGILSDVRPITAGVPQGEVVSPQLYNFYASEVPVDPGTMAALYADDTAFISSSRSLAHAVVKLQRTLDLLPEWLSKWRLSVNPGKSQALAVTIKRGFPPPLKLNDCDIPWGKMAKYLGVIIDRRLNMLPQCRAAIAGALAAAAQLYPIYSAPQVPIRMRLALFRTYILSRLTYAAPVWYHLLAASHRKSIQRTQNGVVRCLVRAPRYVRNNTINRDLRIESVEVFVRRLATNLFTRADTSDLPELEDLAPWHARPPDRRLLPRDAALGEDDDQPRLPPRPSAEARRRQEAP